MANLIDYEFTQWNDVKMGHFNLQIMDHFMPESS